MLAPALSSASDEVPSLLDHILLGCNDLDSGITYVEQITGVRAAFGGVHPGRGTQNALLSLGKTRYLEIIAPDPKQTDIQTWAVQQLAVLKALNKPKLIGWAVHPGNIEVFIGRVRRSGIAIQGPFPGSRTRADGQVVKWKTATLVDDRHGILPFFIEWDASAMHPSVDAPKGCNLERFDVASPQTRELSTLLQRINVDVSVQNGGISQLRATITGPKGRLETTS